MPRHKPEAPSRLPSAHAAAPLDYDSDDSSYEQPRATGKRRRESSQDGPTLPLAASNNDDEDGERAVLARGVSLANDETQAVDFDMDGVVRFVRRPRLGQVLSASSIIEVDSSDSEADMATAAPSHTGISEYADVDDVVDVAEFVDEETPRPRRPRRLPLPRDAVKLDEFARVRTPCATSPGDVLLCETRLDMPECSLYAPVKNYYRERDAAASLFACVRPHLPGTPLLLTRRVSAQRVAFLLVTDSGSTDVRVRGRGASLTDALHTSDAVAAALARLVADGAVRCATVQRETGLWLQSWLTAAWLQTCAQCIDGALCTDLTDPRRSMMVYLSSLGVLRSSCSVLDAGMDAVDAVSNVEWCVPSRIVRESQIPFPRQQEEIDLRLALLGTSRPLSQVHIEESDVYDVAAPAWGDVYEHPSIDELRDSAAAVQTMLKPTLRRYQQRAVRWMYDREAAVAAHAATDEHDPLWMEVEAVDGTRVYANVLGGLVTVSAPPKVARAVNRPGGVLADSMGLGKTVTTLALVSATAATARAAAQVSTAVRALHDRVFAPRLLWEVYAAVASRMQAPTFMPAWTLEAQETSGATDASSTVLRLHVKPVQSEGSDELFLTDDGMDVEHTPGAKEARPTAGAVCICGHPYEDPLPEDVQLAVTMFGATHMRSQRRGRTKLVPIATRKHDELPWVACSVCGGWQHDACSLSLADLTPEASTVIRARWSMNTDAARVCLYCQHDILRHMKVASSATLIVTPVPIEGQWQAEIARHLRHSDDEGRALRVMRYQGVGATVDQLTSLLTAMRARTRQRARAGKTGEDNELAIQRETAQELVRSLSPLALSGADIILTNYTALAHDINQIGSSSDVTEDDGDAFVSLHDFVDDAYLRISKRGTLGRSAPTDSGRALRFSKKYRVIPSALLPLRAWRVVLDEAQMIDTPTAQAAQMAGRLSAQHYWCVSGTPLARSPSDLHGLLVFLGWSWYSRTDVFYRCLYDAASHGDVRALRAFLQLASDSMWRVMPEEVADELGIPECCDEAIALGFSRIEDAYYAQQAASSVQKVDSVLQRWRAEERSGSAAEAAAGLLLPRTGHRTLDPDERKAILQPMTRLRQACVHPQLSSDKARRGGANAGLRQSGDDDRSTRRRVVLPMEEVLKEMTTNVKVQAEDALRTLVAALHGLAGLHWLKHAWQAAAAQYAEVIDLSQRSEASDGAAAVFPRVDALPVLHACRNFCQLLQEHRLLRTIDTLPQCLRSLNDVDSALSRVRAIADQVEERYISAAASRVVVEARTLQSSMHSLCKAASLTMPHRMVDIDAIDRTAADVAVPAAAIVQPSCVDALAAQLNTLGKDTHAVLSSTIMQLIKRAGSSQDGLRELLDEAQAMEFQDEITNVDALQGSGGAVAWPVTSFTELLHYTTQALKALTDTRARCAQLLPTLLCPDTAQLAATRECSACRSYFNKKGDPCELCVNISPAFTAYRRQFRVARYANTDEGFRAKHGEVDMSAIVAGKRHRRKRILPGAAGDLTLWLHRELAQQATGDGEENAGAVSFLPGEDVRDSYLVDSALVRVVKRAIDICRARGLSTVSLPAGARIQGEDVPADTPQNVLKALQEEVEGFMRLRDAQRELIDVVEETEDAALRMQLAPPEEETSDEAAVFRVRAAEIPVRMDENRAQAEIARVELFRRVGQWKYLHNIAQEQEASSRADADATTCPVCMDRLGGDKGKVAVLSCGHRFCYAHLPHLSRKCPQCRQLFDASDIRQATMSAQAAEAAVAGTTVLAASAASPAVAAMPNEVTVSAASKPAAFLCSLRAHVADIRVHGSYGSKIDALVKCLKALSDGVSGGINLFGDTEESLARARGGGPVQALVFSQWDEALCICEAALTRNGIKCVHAAGAKAVARAAQLFVTDPSITVLLLPFKAGAEGLNLTCATHVFLLDPLLDPALEQQAIGRVRRLGQERPTFVHRFVMRDTVETVIVDVNHAKARRVVHGNARSAGDGNEVDAVMRRILDRAMQADADDEDDRGRHGKSDDASATREDVARMFARTQALQAQHQNLGQQLVGDGGSTMATAAPLTAAAASSPEEDAEVTMQRARRNFRFWSRTRVTLPGRGPMIRLALLSALQAAHASPQSADVSLFGKMVAQDIALQLISGHSDGAEQDEIQEIEAVRSRFERA